MKTTYITILSFVLLLSNTLHSEELKASEVAAAQGMQWWSIIPPELESEKMSIYFEIEFSDGTKKRTGSTSFTKGDKIKVFCWPNLQGELEVSAVLNGGEAVMKTRFSDNPFAEAKVTITPGKSPRRVKAGEFLTKGSTARSVSSEQKLEKGAFGLRVVIEPYKNE